MLDNQSKIVQLESKNIKNNIESLGKQVERTRMLFRLFFVMI